MLKGKLELKDTIILFDRDLGISFFENFRGYDDLVDDAEWLLERNPQKSRGFIIRPVSTGNQDGVWVGEYNYKGTRIIRQNTLFDREASLLSRTILDYAARKISEKRFMKRIAIDRLKRKLGSRIVQDFKYYVCPVGRFYHSCIHIENVYISLKKKHGRDKKIPYSVVAQEIRKTKPCEDVIICPLIVPNSFERVLNLNRALKSRKLGEIRLVGSDMVEIS